MPLRHIHVRWLYGLHFRDAPSTKMLKNAGGYLSFGYKIQGSHREMCRIAFSPQFGTDNWRVYLRLDGDLTQDQWREVDSVATIREARAMASRFVRSGARAVAKGNDFVAEPDR